MTPQNLNPINGRILLKVIEVNNFETDVLKVGSTTMAFEKRESDAGLILLNNPTGKEQSNIAEIVSLPLDMDISPLKVGDMVLFNRNAGSIHYFDIDQKEQYRLLKKDDIYGIITPDSSSDEQQEDN